MEVIFQLQHLMYLQLQENYNETLCIMKRYRIEEDDTNDLSVFIQIFLCILFLPIGIIVLIVKGWIYFSEKSREKEFIKNEIKASKHSELRSLAELRDMGVITETEFQDRKNKILKDI